MAPISPIPHQTHLEINKNRGPKSLPFAVLNLSCLELHSANGYKIFTFWASKAPILLFVCSNPSRARHKEWFQASSKVTRLTCLVAKRSICGWKMFWSWSSMMKPLATWVTWQVRHEQISFFASSTCCNLFSHGQGPQEGLRRATNSAILATPPLSWFSLKT